MWKAVVAGTTALVIAGGGLAFAQSNQRTDTPRAQRTVEDITARADARLARVKARLRLTPEQEKNWPPVEAAVRDLAKERADRISQRRAERKASQRPDPIERIRERADAMAARAAGLEKFADAADPLYKSLDDQQKQRLAALVRNSGSDNMRGRRAKERHHGRHRGDRRDGRTER